MREHPVRHNSAPIAIHAAPERATVERYLGYLRTLLEGRTTAQAVQELTEQYAVDADIASQDVEDLLGELRSAGLVQEEAAS